jgi:glycosyltransferase involved in cell wall biosynthesis
LHDPPTVLTVARLHRQKRLDLLIDAAAGWRGRPDAPQVLVAGDGPLAAALRARSAAAGSPVRFLGARTDVADLIEAADVVVLPSDWEARPFVAQEALRAGVPLVATDVGGVRDLVGDAAVLVPPGDAAALRQAVDAVLADAEVRRRLRETGPMRAQEWPGPAEMASEVESIYLDLTSRSRAADV